jgi:Uma2 family endonuclease
MNALTPLFAEQRVTLQNISWKTFEQLLAELGEQRNSKLAYDSGYLEIMSPLGFHENSNRFIDDLIRVMADELNLNCKKFGSLTLKRAELLKAVEPDSCYYFQNEPQVRHQREINLACDPPPDLALEIDMTSGSLAKHNIYAAIAIPELWQYDGEKLNVFVLTSDGTYQNVEQSPTFPWLTLEKIPEVMEQSLNDGETLTLREFRAWVRSQSKN